MAIGKTKHPHMTIAPDLRKMIQIWDEPYSVCSSNLISPHPYVYKDFTAIDVNVCSNRLLLEPDHVQALLFIYTLQILH